MDFRVIGEKPDVFSMILQSFLNDNKGMFSVKKTVCAKLVGFQTLTLILDLFCKTFVAGICFDL
mgnify:CR=1 FL=1